MEKAAVQTACAVVMGGSATRHGKSHARHNMQGNSAAHGNGIGHSHSSMTSKSLAFRIGACEGGVPRATPGHAIAWKASKYRSENFEGLSAREKADPYLYGPRRCEAARVYSRPLQGPPGRGALLARADGRVVGDHVGQEASELQLLQ